MKYYLLIVLIALQNFGAYAQNENSFRSTNNPLYWQNRKPNAGYWQQDVHYSIDARIDEDSNMIEGKEELEYWNNSPDTLNYVYFHLFQNAFVKGSHLHDLERMNKVKPKLGKREVAGLGTVLNLLQANGEDVKMSLDNTVLKVFLNKPLYPGQKIVFKINFKTYYDNGGTRRRMQMWNSWGFTHYNGTQWFPKICVFDHKFGWDTYQHLNKEFYGDFGSYDVKLDFPSNYIVEATGVLQNRDEVLPKELRDKLDIKNFATKKWNEQPSTIIPYVKGQRKTWIYHADNVHDFAFTADPSYRIGTAYWNGIECVALVQEPHASGWQNAPEYIAKIIETFSEDIGMYGYPKMVAADAQDGMEYPMLTLDGGRDPSYRSLLVHEIGHNWFYGMVGSNETYRAAMDEGFTQFLTAWGLRRIDGNIQVTGVPRSRYRRKYFEPVDVLDRNVLLPYVYDALNQDEVQINTWSDDFNNGLNHGGGYRLVYFKTASMLYNLQYVLGDSLFQAAMKHYFNQWRFAHPYFEDFRESMINFTHVDLNWFFDEWFETTKQLDYGIASIKKIHGVDSFAIKFKRTADMQMPVDFTVTAKNKQKYSYYIPNTWDQKKTDAIILPKWYSWGKFEPTYTAHVAIPSGIRYVQIDTTYRLADRDMEDNYRRRVNWIHPAGMEIKRDGGLAEVTDRRKYRLYTRPDIWWNAVDGIKPGWHFEGDYMNTLHKIDATVWLNTHLLQDNKYQVTGGEGYYDLYPPVNYTFNYMSPVCRNMPKLQVQINSRLLDGLNYHRAGFNREINSSNIVQVYGIAMWRQLQKDLDYLLYPNEWSSMQGNINSTANLSWTHHYNYFKGNGHYTISGRAPFYVGGSQAFDYSYAQLEAINNSYLGKLILHTRVFARYGAGNSIPYESALFLAGANPEQLMEDKYTRSVGFVPDDWRGISEYDVNHFQEGGGLNLRGYAGYFAQDQRNGTNYIAYKGRSGASVNIEADVENYINLKPAITKNWLHTDLYLFADAGMMELSQYADPDFWKTTPTNMWSDVRIDAGFGLAFTVKSWGVFEKARPLTIRLDVPVFINRAPYSDPRYAAIRYVLGINRCF
jgi:aminopeptidase N